MIAYGLDVLMISSAARATTPSIIINFLDLFHAMFTIKVMSLIPIAQCTICKSPLSHNFSDDSLVLPCLSTLSFMVIAWDLTIPIDEILIDKEAL